jgi:hypothetical protein
MAQGTKMRRLSTQVRAVGGFVFPDHTTYFAVDHAAQELARKGLTGAIGEPLPNLMSGDACKWINSHTTDFQVMVASWRRILNPLGSVRS